MKETTATLIGFSVVAFSVTLGFIWIDKRAKEIDISIKQIPQNLRKSIGF
jgi:hypothetical protein